MYYREQIEYSEHPIVAFKGDYFLLDELEDILGYEVAAYLRVDHVEGETRSIYVPLFAKRGE